MPGPPTPLSGCPLKRFEIHDRSTSRVYDAVQLANSLTFTLEAQRSVNADNHSLVLQVHCGLQRVLSIKLTDLLKSPHDKTETISIERPSQRLCINVHQQSQTILADFEETRDFNVAVCMLKKFGFRIKDGISASFTNASSRPTSPLHAVPPGANFGPRLSAITPLAEPDSPVASEVQQAFSFTSMLNSDFIPTQSNDVYHQFNPTYSTTSSQFVQTPLPQNSQMPLTQQAPPAAVSLSHLNPYNMFLGKQNNYFHPPRVSSPLRNSFEAETPSTPPTMAFSHSFHVHQSPVRTAQNHRSISAPIVPSNSPQRFGYSSQGPPDRQSQAEDRQSSDLESLPETMAGINDVQSKSVQNFRELMPQPRTLPFARRKKAAGKITSSKIEHNEVEPSSTQRKASTRRSKETQARTRAGFKDNEAAHGVSNKDIKRKSSTKPSAIISSVECQTELPPASSQPAGLSSDSPTQPHSPRVTEVPTMLVADTSVLHQANEVISRLLQQYEVDITRGCDEATCAQFYVEQIHVARRDFWFTQLMDTESRRRMAPV